MSIETVVFFDIDGTLIKTAGASRASMLRALRELYGVQANELYVDAVGRTDRAIVRDLLALHGLEPTDREVERFLARYVEYLPGELRRRPKAHVLPGVPDVLERLSRRPDVAIGLLTGNARHGAYRKLRHFGLDHFFPFGGFGDRWLDRADVAKEALEAAEKSLGQTIDPGKCWVVGDTVHDVTCARAIGAKAIAVLTGWSLVSDLYAVGPDAVIDDLTELDTLLKC